MAWRPDLHLPLRRMTASLTLLDIRATDGERREGGVVEPGIRDTGEAYEVVRDGRPLVSACYGPTLYGIISKAEARQWAEGYRRCYVDRQKDAAA